jgi:hypothetical protein
MSERQCSDFKSIFGHLCLLALQLNGNAPIFGAILALLNGYAPFFNAFPWSFS